MTGGDLHPQATVFLVVLGATASGVAHRNVGEDRPAPSRENGSRTNRKRLTRYRQERVVSASVERTVTVRIIDDAKAVSDFLGWQMAEDVFPIRGTVTAGLGGYFGTFDGDDESDLMHYFATRTSGRNEVGS